MLVRRETPISHTEINETNWIEERQGHVSNPGTYLLSEYVLSVAPWSCWPTWCVGWPVWARYQCCSLGNPAWGADQAYYHSLATMLSVTEGSSTTAHERWRHRNGLPASLFQHDTEWYRYNTVNFQRNTYIMHTKIHPWQWGQCLHWTEMLFLRLSSLDAWKVLEWQLPVQWVNTFWPEWLNLQLCNTLHPLIPMTTTTDFMFFQ